MTKTMALTSNYKVFKVAGAGEIRISETADWRTGSAKGFSFDTKWADKEYFLGGVISKEEARELANHILSVLDNKSS